MSVSAHLGLVETKKGRGEETRRAITNQEQTQTRATKRYPVRRRRPLQGRTPTSSLLYGRRLSLNCLTWLIINSWPILKAAVLEGVASWLHWFSPNLILFDHQLLTDLKEVLWVSSACLEVASILNSYKRLSLFLLWDECRFMPPDK